MTEPKATADVVSSGATTNGETGVGSYFISNYPPYSFWTQGHLPAVEEVLDRAPHADVPLGLYLHIPFCRKRCKFCYFRVYTDKNAREVEDYLDALAGELALYKDRVVLFGRPLRFFYFGGGTPSFLSTAQLETLVERLQHSVSWEHAEEVTFECEPGTLSLSKLRVLKSIGVTRLSLGLESWNDDILRENGRAHLSPEICRAWEWIEDVSFPSVNVDLIAGMVGETRETWEDTVGKTIAIRPDSVTIYQMELPFNTVYSREILAGGKAMPVPSWEQKRGWVRWAFEEIEGAGYAVSSGYTLVDARKKPRFSYRDNLWHGADMIGTGVASFSHVSGVHYQNLVSASGNASRPFYFYERNPHESSYTWQVERAWFDETYLQHAAEQGVDVHLEVAASGLLFNADRVEGLELARPDDSLHTVRSRLLVDATGLASLVSRKLDLRKRDPRLGRAAVFSHYENAHRDSGIDEGATLVIHTADGKGWFWYIPLSRNRVSVGVVGYPSDLFRNGESHDETLEREIRACPAVAWRLEKARKLMPALVASDYSYRSTRAAGEGWLLVGDSLGFLDPIYSSGVLLALKSAELAADSVSEALGRGDVSAERLGAFAPEIRRGMEAIRNLVYAFYTPGFSFGDFFTNHPEHRDRVTDILIGNVFKDGVMALFDDLKHYCELPEPARP